VPRDRPQGQCQSICHSCKDVCLIKVVVFSHGHGVVDASNELGRTRTTPRTGLSGGRRVPSHEPQIQHGAYPQ
jgi:hypothetical protein